MFDTDFDERIDGEWVTIRQAVLTRDEYERQSREWIYGARVGGGWIVADGQRRVHSWEF